MANVKTVQLGKKAASFFDPISKLNLTPGEVKEAPTGRKSWVYREALRGGHIVEETTITQDPPKVDPPKVDPPGNTEPSLEEQKAELLKLTRDEIMANYPFLDEDDLAEAKKKNTKADLVDFLKDIESDYED